MVASLRSACRGVRATADETGAARGTRARAADTIATARRESSPSLVPSLRSASKTQQLQHTLLLDKEQQREETTSDTSVDVAKIAGAEAALADDDEVARGTGECTPFAC